MPKRIRRDHPNTELRGAKVLRARKQYECVWCVAQVEYLSEKYEFETPNIQTTIAPNEVYARISETRLPVCSAHFMLTDIVETDK